MKALAVGVAATLSAAAVAAQPMDLAALVEAALADNPGLRAVEEQRREVAAGVVEARADAFPQLDAIGAWNRSRDPSLLNSPDFEEIIQQFPGFEPSEQEIWALAVELSQTLYSGGQVKAAIELARVAEAVIEARVDTARLDVATEVARVYYQLLSARRSLATVELQERARREALEMVENRLELGDATRLEALRAQASLAEVGPELAARRGRVTVLENELRRVIGRDHDEALEVAEVSGGLPEAPTWAALMAEARRNRPEIADLELQMEGLGLQQTIAAADGKPQVELDGRYGHTARLPENLDSDLYADWAVGLSLRWSFFDGGRRAGEVAQLESRAEQLRWQIEDLLRRIEVEIEDSLTAYSTARERWLAAEVSAEAAR